MIVAINKFFTSSLSLFAPVRTILVSLFFLAALSNCGSIKGGISSTQKGLASLRFSPDMDIYQESRTINNGLSTNKDLKQKDFQGKLKSVTIGDNFSNNIWGDNCDCR